MEDQEVPMPPAPRDNDMDEEMDLLSMIKEGGVKLQNFLLAQSIPYSVNSVDFDIHNYLSNFPDAWSIPNHYRNNKDVPDWEAKKWDEACKEEIKGLKEQHVFKEVKLPQGCKAIGC